MKDNSLYKDINYVRKYDEIKYGGRFGKYLRDKEITKLTALVDPDCISILDVGSGTGKISISSRLSELYIISLDGSYSMLEYSKIKADRHYIRYIPVVCDSDYICFKDGSFDCVIASRVLMHCNDWKRTLSEICRVSGKIVLLDFPNLISSSGLDSLIKSTVKPLYKGIIAYKTFSINTIINELAKNNFRSVYLDRGFFLPLMFHRILDNPVITDKLERLFGLSGLTKLLGSPVILKSVKEQTL